MPPASPEERPDHATIALRPPRERIERRAIAWWALQAVVVPGALPAVLGVAFVLWDAARGWLIVPLALAVLVTAVAVVVEPLWRYRVHRWETTDEAVYALTGWIVREWRVAPLSRVQTVDAIQGPIEQVLGLSTLRVTTASSRGAIEIGGLDKATADRVAAELAQVAQAIPGDAT